MQNAPEIFVFDESRKTGYGVIKHTTEFIERPRFNFCSELEFTIPEKICDPISGKWLKNPCYDRLEKNNLLYINDDTQYFEYPYKNLATYSYRSPSSMQGRNPTDLNCEVNRWLNNFELEDETLLYTPSTANGYQWVWLSEINQYGYKTNFNWSACYTYLACPQFIPIKPYDVIAIKTADKVDAVNYEIKFTGYNIFFYTDNNANSIVGRVFVGANGSSSEDIANPVFRFNINSLSKDDNVRSYARDSDGNLTTYQGATAANMIKTSMENGGYIRISTTCNFTTSSSVDEKKKYTSYYYVDDMIRAGWTYPDNRIKIYSGERLCKNISNGSRSGMYTLPLHWFVIKDIEVNSDGKVTTKKVIANSYEYTLSNRRISCSEKTMPFYIPDSIKDTIEYRNWFIDKEKGTVYVRQGKQYLETGIFNIILQSLPDWSLGNISSELMTRYRGVSSVDNQNLYSYMMNDIESLYQCYFVFDNDNKTISAYTHEDIIEAAQSNNDIILNWNNALKSFKVADVDTNYITSLKVHTSEDTYGLGLVYPTGNSKIYNFDSVLDKMDFVADSSQNRTLKQAVQSLISFIDRPTATVGNRSINGLSSYRNIGKLFAESNLSLIEKETAIFECSSNYKSVLDRIATRASQNNINNYYKDEFVRTEEYIIERYRAFELSSGDPDGAGYFGDLSLYGEILNASKSYWSAYNDYQTELNNYNTYKELLSAVAKKTNLNYYTQKKLRDSGSNSTTYSILSPMEILALQPFIIEGDITDENSVFSEDYDAKDIVNTLIDVCDRAKYDMDLFFSKPTYDFECDLANILAIPEMASQYRNIKMGKVIYINHNDSEYVEPILLEIEIDYKDKSNFKMKFTSDYKRKPERYRFSELYNNMSQTSTSDNTFDFSE